MHAVVAEIREKQNITKEQLQILLETKDEDRIEDLMAAATASFCRRTLP